MFTLWDWRSLDPVAMCETLDDALRIVRTGIELNGPTDTDTLTLVLDEPDAEPVAIADGAGLAALARVTAPPTKKRKLNPKSPAFSGVVGKSSHSRHSRTGTFASPSGQVKPRETGNTKGSPHAPMPKQAPSTPNFVRVHKSTKPGKPKG